MIAARLKTITAFLFVAGVLQTASYCVAQDQFSYSNHSRQKKSQLKEQPQVLGVKPHVLPEEYTRDSVKNIFDTTLESLEQKELVLHRDAKVIKQEKEATAKKARKKKSQTTNEKPAQELSLRQQLVEKFGDPSSRPEIKTLDTAPKPYQAMYEALNNNDEELAYEYAIQYVRYQREMQEARNRAVAIEGVAMVKEDMLSANSWPMQDNYQQYHYLLDKEVPELQDSRPQSRKDQEMMDRRQLDSEARGIINRLKKSEHDLFNNRGKLYTIADELDEQIERQKARKLLKYKLPRDPQGKVAVYFFIRARDQDARSMAADVEKLYRSVQGGGKVSIVGLSIDRTNQGDLASFRNKTGISFPLISGEVLAKKMQITQSPTLIFSIESNGKFHLEEGLRNYYYIDEIIKIMQGS